MKERLHNIAQDMYILNRCCGEEIVRSSLAWARRAAPKERRQAQRKRVRPVKQACSEVIQRKRAQVYKEDLQLQHSHHVEHLAPPSHHHLPFQQQHLSSHNPSQVWHRFLVCSQQPSARSKQNNRRQKAHSTPARACLAEYTREHGSALHSVDSGQIRDPSRHHPAPRQLSLSNYGIESSPTRARVRLPLSQTAVSFKATNRSRFRIDLWFEWWERGRGIVGTHKQPPGLQTLSSTPGQSLGSGTSPWQENIALLLQIQRRHVCPWLDSFSTSSLVFARKSSRQVRLAPYLDSGHRQHPKTSKTKTVDHNSPRRRTKHHLSTTSISHAATVLALCRGRPRLARSIPAQSSVAACQGARMSGKRRGAVWTHGPRRQTSTNQRSILPEQPPNMEMVQREKPARSYLGFSCYMKTLAIARSIVSSPRETCAEGTGPSYDGLRARSGHPLHPRSRRLTSVPREHLRSGHCSQARRVLSAHTRCAPSLCRQDRRRLLWTHGHYLRLRTKTLGVGPSTWLEAAARVCPNLRFGFSVLYHSSRCSVCKSSFVHNVRFSLDGTPMEVTSPSTTVSHGCRENRKRHLRSRRCRDSGAPCNESSQHRAKHQKSAHCGIHFASYSVDPLLVPGISRCRASNVDASQTLGSRRSRTEPPREEPARTCHPLGIQHGRARHNPRGSRGVPRSWRDCARSLAWAGGPPSTSSRQRSRQCGAPKRNRRRPPPQWGAPCTKLRVLPKNKQHSTSHHFLAIISPRQPMHLTIQVFDPSLCISHLNWVTRFLISATWPRQPRLCTVGCTQLPERARNFAPCCSGKTSSSGNG